MNKTTACILWSVDRTEPLINQLTQDLTNGCLEALPDSGSAVKNIDEKKYRIIRKSVGKYTAIAVSSDINRIKSKKVIESEIDTFLAAAPTIDSAIERAEGRTRRLLHNLKSLTAKTSQEVFYIAQQDVLMVNPREAVPYVAQEIRENSEAAARAFLEILKHQSAQKAEYTAFDRLSGKLEVGAIERHEIHRVLMNVFYLFFGEFIAKKVRVDVGQTYLQGIFDYDSIHVCIYYLVENAAKYARSKGDFSVSVRDDGNGFIDVRFVMESLIILADEKERIFEEGYSGVNAVDEKLSGAGLGLYLARAMAKLNGGQLNVIPGHVTSGGKYARNVFVLTLPSR
ncbi:sensor histidine kinase [Burkholderia gladioli]|uniref:sensor histidine kinase n=1 Tax=Burkholderia gladioli TaxID=28095 RepID=UPI0016406AE4|nr:ATP-binding protein [Burkholderia gladioli]MBJ9673208.1 ATP-binding protein [Burkholderia gladioli]MDN7460055.1 ATP-binding protein [Burkholderia gladioli]